MNNQGINTSPNSLTRTFFLLLVLAAFGSVSLVRAQTTSFTYQGRLTDSGTVASATYDMQFKLFDSANAGSQIGSTITNGAVTVNNGVFTVQLDYGAAAFSGSDRYLEIGVRLAGDANPYTILAPRQQLTSAVYAIRAGSTATADTAAKADSAKKADSATVADTATTATNATQLGGVTASQYVLTSDSRLSDPRPPTPGSSSYLQNTLIQQSANFNISGDGTAGGTLSANTVNATTQYNLGGKRVLSAAGSRNIFVGELAGAANTFGFDNSFFGNSAGAANTSGRLNSFFGSSAGAANTSGVANSFFGNSAGAANTSGGNNAFFGYRAGASNTSGDVNSFFGFSAGAANTTGISNSFFGAVAGASNTTGILNSFFGSLAGTQNTEGSNNSFFGRQAGGVNTLGGGNSFFGLLAGSANTTGVTNSFFGSSAGAANISGDNNTAIGHLANMASGDLDHATAIGAGAVVTSSNTIMLGRSNGSDKVVVPGLGAAGANSVCRNANNELSTCSSSLRYKKDLQPFTRGLSLLNSLKPITFRWKADNSSDLGFGAEDIAAIEPLLVTRNDKGEVEGVKYDRITAVLVNAIKEQQKQIEGLKKLVCQHKRRAAVCK